MIDRQGHIMHIDFGFILGIAPGGAFSLEKDAAFKLTVEMVELMGGQESEHFQRFRQRFLEGMLAVRREYIKVCIGSLCTAQPDLPGLVELKHCDVFFSCCRSST